MSTLTEEFTEEIDDLVPRLVHHLAYHQLSPISTAMAWRVRELIGDDRDRFEYVCWAHAMVMASAGRSATVVVRPGLDVGNGLEPIDIDQADPPHRTSVRYLNAAINRDRDMAIALFAAVPFEDLQTFFHSLILAVTEIVRYTRWEACE